MKICKGADVGSYIDNSELVTEAANDIGGMCDASELKKIRTERTNTSSLNNRSLESYNLLGCDK